MKLDDYTMPLRSVMSREAVYSAPLEIAERMELFDRWVEANPDAVSEMEAWAVEIGSSGQPVSVQRLFERKRWDGSPIVAVPYTDCNGRAHRYSINHNDRSLFGRWLQKRHPELRVSVRRSMFDGGSDGE